MEIVLAIVWYLALLMPNTTYTQEDIYNIGVQNQPIVQSVYENNLNDAMDFYNSNRPEDNGVVLAPGTWEDEPVNNTDTTLYDPWDRDILKKENK